MADPRTVDDRRRQTAAAREALARTFPSEEARSQHYRELARRSHPGRIVLSADDAHALSRAYAVLKRIAERGNLPVTVADDPADSAHPVDTVKP